MTVSRWSRWAPLSGAVFVVLWIVAFALSNNVDTGDPDAKIVAYYNNSSHRHREIATFFLVLAASLLFVWFLSVLRGRLMRAQGNAGGLTSAAVGAGLVSAALWVVSMALFDAQSLARSDSSKFVFDANTFRLTQSVGYAVWFSATTIAAVAVVATAIVSLRFGGLLPKWIAWLSFVVAATMLVAFFFVPFLIFLGWTLVVSLVLIWRHESAVPAAQAAQAT
jgi:hypothetical protein